MPVVEKIIPLEIYTDGSCKKLGNKTFGGWAYIIVRDGQILAKDSDYAIDTTNQRMELTAAVEALKIASNLKQNKEGVILYSDSAYLINCCNQRWYLGWQANGWVNSSKKEVANQDLWIPLIPYFDMIAYSFQKVKGHADNVFNNRCDQMAQRAADEAKINWRGISNE